MVVVVVLAVGDTVHVEFDGVCRPLWVGIGSPSVCRVDIIYRFTPNWPVGGSEVYRPIEGGEAMLFGNIYIPWSTEAPFLQARSVYPYTWLATSSLSHPLDR